ncbi:MAG: efflux transporter outer membrane subunit [Deltaproteobacteria bacterium]|jgi:multidrug efflux system outer membrane protein|nr:efflux transporter outer membrane subunit [Deltaproteobacteria bacterium]
MRFTSKKILFLAALMALGLMSACTMAPEYERPDSPVPEEYPDYPVFTGVGKNNPDDQAKAAAEPVKAAAPAQDAAFDEFPAAGNQPWREFFLDPALQRLIALSLENNRDLRVAVLNIERARARYEIERADLFPSIQASGQNSNQLLPADLANAPHAVIARQTSVTVGFTSFELDLFGRIRSLKNAALENFFSITQNAHSARVSLVAEVASAYLTLVSYRELYDLTEQTHATRTQSYDLAKSLFDQGLTSQMDLNQARTAMEDARVTAARYRTDALRYENALALLVGAALPRDLEIPRRLADIQTLKEVPEGLPSGLMERRPDILAAEHGLRSANANIGAARASFFPRIGLTSNFGTISTEFDNLFEGASKTWAFIPSISLPIFEGGRLMANLRVSETDKKIAVANYEKAVQAAFREVADALAFRSTAAEQVDAATALRDAARETYDLSLVRYDVGVDSFLNVLDSQRTYFTAQQAYVNTILNREINTLNLYKALGGGWE